MLEILAGGTQPAMISKNVQKKMVGMDDNLEPERASGPQGTSAWQNYNVNPGLINPVYGCLIGGIPFYVSYCDYLDGTPTINKPWFSKIRG